MAKKLKEPKLPTQEEVLGQLAEQQGKEALNSGPAPIVEPTPMSAEEKRQAVINQNLSSLDNPTNTAEALAEQQGKESLSNTPDFNRTQVQDALQGEYKSFAQWAIDTRKNAEAQLEEEKQEIEREKKAAAATGWAEFGSALVNLFGVGEGNAVSQNYKSYSQDWMQKADADQRAHRNRVHDLRQRQIDTELKMNQLRQAGAREMMQFDRQRELDRATLALRQAQTEAQNAQTEARRQEAERKANEAQKQIELLEAKIKAQDALAGQRVASGKSSLIRAGAAASGTSNQNKNRDKSTESKVNVDSSKIMKNLGQSGFAWDPIRGYYNLVQAQPENYVEVPGKEEKKKGVALDKDGFPSF